MKNKFKFIIIILISVAISNNIIAKIVTDNHLKLWYNKPAKEWIEALPVGNGFLGAMIYGIPAREEIQLNEITIWGGQPHRNDNTEAKKYLKRVRKLIFSGKYAEAQQLVEDKFISKISHGMPYQTAGSLVLNFPHHKEFTDYYRELNLEKGIVKIKYKVNGVAYTRTVFTPLTEKVIVVKIDASEKGQINFNASLKHPLPVKIKSEGSNKLLMQGVTSDCDSIKGAVKFLVLVKIITDGGIVYPYGNELVVEKANSASIYISVASSFKNYKDISDDPYKKAKARLKSALKKSYNNLLSEHISQYQRFFKRVEFSLGEDKNYNIPTDERLKNFANENDLPFLAICFQFGRYLLISSSQPGGQPATLQGIWNKELYPPWDSKYTLNINAEMNYWPSEITNLPEMKEPLIKMVKELAVTGKKTAETMYGANGWVVHHNTDIWRITGPVDGAFWGMWPTGGAWLCQPLFEKYEYNGDVEYLRYIYPVMKSACEFFLAFLVKEPKHGWLVVCPSVSPENSPSIHKKYSVCAGATMDNQLLFDLFTKTIRAAKILHTDYNFVERLKNVLRQLPPMQIGRWGQLQEWMEDWDDPKDKHRHVSHLYGLYPSNQISPYTTPELFSAARTSLIARGDESTGWSMAWKIALWARLFDGNHAYKLIKDLVSPAILPDGSQKGGLYPNLFCSHPPFQIDGNFGLTAGITEMLMQSHDGAIHFLPALPDEWRMGKVSGLRTRGGFEVSFSWKNGQVQQISIKSNLGGNCRIRVPNEVTLIGGTLQKASGENPNQFFAKVKIKKPIIADSTKLTPVTLKPTFLYDFDTEPGNTYRIVNKKQTQD